MGKGKGAVEYWVAVVKPGRIMFEIGGLHVMCLDKQREFVAGNRIPVTLVFQKSGEIIIEAEIREE